MRIDAYNQIQAVYQAQAARKPQATAKTGTSFVDKLQLSSIGKDIQTAKQAVANAPDIRPEVTEPIKAQIAAGTYNVSAESFADKLLEKYQASIIYHSDNRRLRWRL
ncbi:MAG: flagellar biosynthesis anti-sigma factor FlgM [Lachnospiraceae bacterium]|nr:flagellar biosynthesis anti-sigma factor FlgM [Lachnospiraceae bacterium]